MSQIAGMLHLDGGIVSEEYARLQLEPLSAAPHDRQGSWRDGPVALAHLALDISDEDALDRQPLIAGAGWHGLTWDGRLFNRGELHQALPALRNRLLSDIPDSQLVLESWLQWGKDCPNKFVGDFAFAVWDATQRVLFLARDRMGMRPLYYANTGRLFAFASQIKGVRGLPGVDRRLDEEWVADYLSLTHLSRENTACRGIRRLPAAHWMTVSVDGRVRKQEYWRLRDEPVLKFERDEDYYGHLREVTKRAVHDRMPGRGPVASMLSGGLDSSTVTAFACQKARMEGRRVIAVSSVLPEDHAGPETDERRYMQAFLQQYPACEWVPVTAPGKHFLSDLDRLLAICDQPVRDAFHYSTLALGEEARRSGARVLLTGMGGDFFVSSRVHGAFARMLVELKWRRLWNEYRRAREATPELTSWAFARSELLRPFLVSSPLAGLLEWLRVLSPHEPFTTAASARLSRDFALARRQRTLAEAGWNSPWQGLGGAVQRIAASGLVAHIFEYFSALGTSLGLQLESPLLDHRIVAAVAALPVELRRDAVWPRVVVRKVAAGALPDAIRLRRDKLPFSPDNRRRASVACREMRVLDPYEPAAQKLEDLLDWERVRLAASSLREKVVHGDDDLVSVVQIFSAASLVRYATTMVD
jgi:asparagine synthase (glutamine-hydrolysing)